MNSYKGINVLIFGLGLNQGGVGSAKFFATQGANVRVTDLKSEEILKPSIDLLKEFPKIEYSLGEHKNDDIDWADLIIKNPSVKSGNIYIEYAKSKGKKIETDMGIFFNLVDKSKIIGVTGTKGKSTTASLIYEAFKAGGKKTILAGNIGKSVLDSIPLIQKDTLVVLEISSFQLEGLSSHKVSPKYAVVTNIYPDHLNYYPGMLEYISAKRLITQFQTNDDYLFLNKDDVTLNNPKFITGLSANIIFYSKSDLPGDLPAGRQGFNPTLMGEHNLENMAAALKVVQIFGLDEKQILQALSDFKGVPFRMELIRTWNGVKIINDTTATTPDAAIAALKSFNEKIILICGGMNKGMDYKKLGQTIDDHAKAVYFLEGDIVDEIIENFGNQSVIKGRFNNFEELLLKLKDDLGGDLKEDIILFSPAGTSYNLFQNEFDRGRQFNKAVEKIFQ
ncbi:UDP-N-acetylmuramoylalanine--D-glutamate ligase [Candidatus Daviesbacteria bacterium RIFCSPLOWO2_01_FULL_36_8]|nr:MAG: UDP-N-acetylmuramoylalanine--D-glutamate ligase [Candidatus Daviesbacteria bacterium RIFCSPLOWO2_01_FULL_36_8]